MHSEATGSYSFDLVKLYALEIAPETQRWLFLAFTIAFAIKVPLFPDALAAWSPLIGLLAVVGIVYGALVAMVQPDMKKLVAYSSVSHLGFVMHGIASLNAVALESEPRCWPSSTVTLTSTTG